MLCTTLHVFVFLSLPPFTISLFCLLGTFRLPSCFESAVELSFNELSSRMYRRLLDLVREFKRLVENLPFLPRIVFIRIASNNLESVVVCKQLVERALLNPLISGTSLMRLSSLSLVLTAAGCGWRFSRRIMFQLAGGELQGEERCLRKAHSIFGNSERFLYGRRIGPQHVGGEVDDRGGVFVIHA